MIGHRFLISKRQSVSFALREKYRVKAMVYRPISAKSAGDALSTLSVSFAGAT
jgi:hypothetical protein